MSVRSYRERTGGGGVRMPQMLPVELGGIEGIACLADEFLVVRNLRAEGGEQVAHDGGIDADVQGLLYGFVAELGASAGKTEVSGRIDEAEQGDGDQHLFFAQGRLVFQGCSRNGAEQVDGDGLHVQVLQGKGEFDALFHRFAHADDTAATDVHAHVAGSL